MRTNDRRAARDRVAGVTTALAMTGVVGVAAVAGGLAVHAKQTASSQGSTQTAQSSSSSDDSESSGDDSRSSQPNQTSTTGHALQGGITSGSGPALANSSGS